MTWITIGIQEYFDRRVPSPPLDEVPETSKTGVTWAGDYTYRRVLNTTRTMTTKKVRARSACCDLLKERNMTSMVLRRSRSVTSLAKVPWPTYRRSVLLYLNGLNTRSKRNVRKIENLKNEA